MQMFASHCILNNLRWDFKSVCFYILSCKLIFLSFNLSVKLMHCHRKSRLWSWLLIWLAITVCVDASWIFLLFRLLAIRDLRPLFWFFGITLWYYSINRFLWMIQRSSNSATDFNFYFSFHISVTSSVWTSLARGMCKRCYCEV